MSDYRPAPIIVFAGPSLAGWRAELPFERRAPAQAGDMLGLLRGPPCTVILIDGLFGARRSVWHKEILVLLGCGHRVIGAASMGALRAAELHHYGMIGCGPIFRAYAAGRIAADDEVAVVHAPTELGAMPLSVAQVDVRAVLLAALRAAILHARAARALRAVSAAIHYKDRTWEMLIDRGQHAGIDLGAFAAWLPANIFSQKTRDAQAALGLAEQLAPLEPEARPRPPATDYLAILADTIGIDLPR